MTTNTNERGKTAKKNQFPIFGARVPETGDVIDRKLLIDF